LELGLEIDSEKVETTRYNKSRDESIFDKRKAENNTIDSSSPT